jgi:hypothetical protein
MNALEQFVFPTHHHPCSRGGFEARRKTVKKGRMIMKKFRYSSVATIGLLGLMLAPTGLAAVLNPGDANIPATAFGSISGTILADTGVQAFGIPFFTGNFRQIVVRDSVTGFLDFIYEFEVTGGAAGVGRMSTTDFQNQFTDVGYCPTCLDVINLNGANDSNRFPAFLDRSSNGSTISFDFSGEVTTGGDTDPLVIKTHSLTFGQGSTTLLDGGQARLNSFATTIPEPTSAGLVLGGLVVGGLLLNRRRVHA